MIPKNYDKEIADLNKKVDEMLEIQNGFMLQLSKNQKLIIEGLMLLKEVRK